MVKSRGKLNSIIWPTITSSLPVDDLIIIFANSSARPENFWNIVNGVIYPLTLCSWSILRLRWCWSLCYYDTMCIAGYLAYDQIGVPRWLTGLLSTFLVLEMKKLSHRDQLTNTVFKIILYKGIINTLSPSLIEASRPMQQIWRKHI